MKKHLLSACTLRKATLLALLLFITNTLVYAQKVYATSQTYHIGEDCYACSVENPENAVGPDENNYTSIQVGEQLFGEGIQQTLIFPSVKIDTRIVIGFESGSLAMLQGVFVETFNGNASNSDLIPVEAIFKSATSNKGTIEFSTNKPYDRIIPPSFSYQHIVFIMGWYPNSTKDLKIHYAYQENTYKPVTTTSATTAKPAPAVKTLTLFPNPTTGQVTLQGDIDFADADIFVSNTFGREVFRLKFKSKTIDLPAILPAGIYMLTVQTKEGQAYTQKVILTR